MRRKAFTLIELLVVISIIALLLSILTPSLKMAKGVARRIICASSLKSLGQGVYVYANNNDGKLPIGQYSTRETTGTPFGIRKGHLPVYAYVMFYLDGTLGPDVMEATPPKQRIHRNYGPILENSAKWGFGELFMNDIITEGKAFYCPGTPNSRDGSLHFSYKYYSNNETTFPFYNLSAINPDRTRSSYMYVPQNSRKKVQIPYQANTYRNDIDKDSLKTIKAISNKAFTEPLFAPDTARKISELSSTEVMACDILYELGWLPHAKGGGKQAGGVNALFSDISVRFCNNPEAFDVNIWGAPDNPANISVNEYTFRTIISLLK